MTIFHEHIDTSLKNNPELKSEMEFQNWISALGDKIAKLRQKKEYSQEHIASCLQVNQSSIARIEAGQNMTCSTLWKLSVALDEDLNIFGVSRSKKTYEFWSSPNFKPNIVTTTSSSSLNCYISNKDIKKFY